MITNNSRPPFPEFPSTIICGPAKKFVDLYTPIREVPPEFLWVSFLVYFGNLVSPYIQLSAAYSEPRFYAVVLGRSARTRKSTAINLARDFFRDGIQREFSFSVTEGFGSAEGMLKSIKNSEQPSNIVHLDEMNILAAKTGAPGSVGISALNKLFEDHDYDHPLAAVTVAIKNAYLSLLGASTLEDFQRMWDGHHEDTGFFSRLLMVCADSPDRRIAIPQKPDLERLQALQAEVKGILANLRDQWKKNDSKPVELPLAEDAYKLWEKFYNTIQEGKEWDRIETQGMRLMTVLAAQESLGSVPAEIVKQVIDFLHYEVAVRRFVLPVIADNQMAEMEQLIRRCLPEDGGWITSRDLTRATHAHRKGIEIFNRALANLKTDGEIEEETRGQQRRFRFVTSADVSEEVEVSPYALVTG